MLKLYSALGAIQHAVSPQRDDVGKWEKLALKQMGAGNYRIASYEQDGQLIEQIQEIYNKEKMDAHPKVIIYNSKFPNAGFLHTGTILVSNSFLQMMDKEERETVLAHEVVHQQQKSINVIAQTATMIATIAGAVALSNQAYKRVPQRFQNTLTNGGVLFASYVLASHLVTLPFAALMRHQEYKADEGAAWITFKPRKLISALTKLENRVKELVSRGPEEIPETDLTMGIGIAHRLATEEKSGYAKLVENYYADHPPTKDRIERLENIHQQQEKMREAKGKQSARIVKLNAESRASSSPQRA